MTAPAAAVTVTRSESRLRAFDLARGLAVLFMILIHVLGHYGTAETWGSPFGAIVMFLGGPLAAPVFMFLMGASLALSSRSDGRAIARRGVWLLALAYSLNVLRGALPATIGLTTGVVTADGIAPYTPDILLALVDIHQLAGLSLLIIAGLPVVRASPLAALGLAAVVAFVAPMVWGLSTGIAPLDTVLLIVWGAEWYVFFPLFGWFAYPLVGLAYGTLLVRSQDRHAFIRRAGWLGAAAGIAGLGTMVALDPLTGVDDYWRQAPATTVAILGLGAAWLAACDVVVRRVPANRLFELLYGWSARVTSMYCIHWILIAWGVGLVGHRQLDLPALVGAMVVVLALAHRISLAHPRLRGASARTTPSVEPAPVAATLTQAGTPGR
jgi:uncharacterized membrane protein